MVTSQTVQPCSLPDRPDGGLPSVSQPYAVARGRASTRGKGNCDGTAVPIRRLVVDPDLQTLGNLHVDFGFDDYVIKPSSFPSLDAVIAIMNRRPEIKLLRIEGHADPLGGLEYNERMTQARARSVLDYLVDNGADGLRLTAVGFGYRCPLYPYFVPDFQVKNRRVDFVPLEVTGKRLPPPRCTLGAQAAPAAFGRLMVKVTPPGAGLDFKGLTRLSAGEVEYDPDGATMTFGEVLQPGTGLAQVSLDGYKTKTLALTVRAGEAVTRVVRLVRATGRGRSTAAPLPARPPEPTKTTDSELSPGAPALGDSIEPAALNTYVTGSVSWPKGQRAKSWRFAGIPFDLNNSLDCTLAIENPKADLNIDIFYSMAPRRIAYSPGPAPDQIKKLSVRIERHRGAYLVRIQAAQPRDESPFTLFCKLTNPVNP